MARTWRPPRAAPDNKAGMVVDELADASAAYFTLIAEVKTHFQEVAAMRDPPLDLVEACERARLRWERARLAMARRGGLLRAGQA